MQKPFLIVNPEAGKGRAKRLWPRLQKALLARKIAFEYRVASTPQDATRIAEEVTRDFQIIVAVGGDGTVNHVANWVINTGRALGVIPAGSGNDIVKSLGIPIDPFQAIELLKQPCRKRIDVGKVGERYFVNGLGVGLDGWVARENQKIKLLKGHAAYFYAVFKGIFKFPSFPVEIEAPACERSEHLAQASWHYRGQTLMLEVSNGQYYGGAFRLTPHAQIDDGLFDLCVIENLSVLKRLWHAPKALTGKHIMLKETHITRAPKVFIKSSEKLLAHVDGEPLEVDHRGFQVELIKAALDVIV